METYWTLRWLRQENIRQFDAVVLRESLVRAEGFPLVLRVASLPELEPGSRVTLEVGEMDFLERSLTAVYRAPAVQKA